MSGWVEPARSESRRHRWLGGGLYWFCQFAGWGLLVATWIISAFDAGIVNAKAMMIRNACFGLCGVVASHLLRLCIKIMLERFRTVWGRVPWLAFSLAGTAAAMLGMAGMVAWMVPPFNHPGPYLGRIIQVLVYLLAWTGFYFALTNQRNFVREQFTRARLDAALRETELRALKSQINPHFLFNCLNSLRALVPLELERPREAITLLADLLRAALTVGEQPVIPLEKELETVALYLALEQIRFEERLRVRQEIAPAALRRRVPPFLIQGLVENAVKHGVAAFEAGGEIAMIAELRGGLLRVRVSNPGRIGESGESTGLGLKNARMRLRYLFGEAATLTLAQETPEVVTAEVLIPARNDEPLSL